MAIKNSPNGHEGRHPIDVPISGCPLQRPPWSAVAVALISLPDLNLWFFNVFSRDQRVREVLVSQVGV